MRPRFPAPRKSDEISFKSACCRIRPDFLPEFASLLFVLYFLLFSFSRFIINVRFQKRALLKLFYCTGFSGRTRKLERPDSGGMIMGHRHYSISNKDTSELNALLLSITLSKDEEDWQNILHTHPFTEIFYVVEGKGQFLFRDEPSFNIGKGDLIIVPPHSEHTEQSFAGSPLKYYVLEMDGIIFQTKDNSNYSYISCNFSSNDFIATLFDQMLYEVHNHAYGANTICQKLLEILILKIMRTQHLQSVPAVARKMTKECAKIKEYLDTNYAEHITLDTLTALTHMNKYYMAHSFTKYTGLSPIQYLNEVRLETACRLLKTTDFPIADISSATGFSSQSYFTQSFRKKYGITPIKYRQSEETSD